MQARIKHSRRRRGFTRLSSKRQVTVPLEITEALRLQPGDEFRVEASAGRIILTPSLTLAERRKAALEAMTGSGTGDYPPGYLERLRDEWR